MTRASFTPPCLAGIRQYHDAKQEFDLIRRDHRTLAPTGCTAEFCQAGRATHLNEPRVGRDRPLQEVQKEAADFLRECHDHGIIASPKLLDQRIQEVLAEIESSAIDTVVTDNSGQQYEGRAGGSWEQSQAELTYGLKASWKNSRRCIMRSEYETLVLHDLRQISNSKEMAESIIYGMQKAFNGGRIIPTVFLFPPRQPGTRGPMVWNSQILAFAGYQEGNEILGDPANLDLTRSIIDLGWKPPYPRSRWDVLPLVTMAEDDEPYLAELPSDLKRTVRIIHPQFSEQFRSLDLRWVIAPALSRLGFDIGGNQYTASPFVGWFMDSEIGVRDLADPNRYNVLPSIVEALNLSNDPDTQVEYLPEDELLLAISRAQAELNFAVHHSFRRENVMISDSLTCSTKYIEFDDRRKERLGYRLPADPYWLAPPQGSIIPIWHRGAAPNYQPKPMICRHAQNPIKAWNRQASDDRQVALRFSHSNSKDMGNGNLPRIYVFWCSAGVSAAKMARHLCKVMKETMQGAHRPCKVDRPRLLDNFVLEEAGQEDFVFVIASTHGHGEVPYNGTNFVTKYKSRGQNTNAPKFSVFGNGDSSYGDTYNAAAKVIQTLLLDAGCRPILPYHFPGDTSTSNPDWDSFNDWCKVMTGHVLGKTEEAELQHGSSNNSSTTLATPSESTVVGLSNNPSFANLVDIRKRGRTGIMEITINVGEAECQEMDHLRILSPNLDADITRVLALLKMNLQDRLDWQDMTASHFFSFGVDLRQPFKTLSWYPNLSDLDVLKQLDLRSASALDVLESIHGDIKPEMLREICKDMQSIQPRIYSVASCPLASCTGSSMVHLKILVQYNPGGRFSDNWLSQAQPEAVIQFTSANSNAWSLIKAQDSDAPLIIIATGSGIAPVKAILDRKLYDLDKNNQDGNGTISLFIGCKKEDEDLMGEISQPAKERGLLKFLTIMPSNPAKVRVQDQLLLSEVKKHLAIDLKHPQALVFVCANTKAATATAENLSAIVGKDIRYTMRKRYAMEIFEE